eukprot:TRINITY_DN14048_c0_g1_i5.p2 TRINITY_DN14048_c0_g1~~TRINITY_DN14048_c0_g1_i5.p2  ORF type:complete len:122 (+),score=35.76 TRINITY_DN14048_c0_g1_i5:246-611(+)
MQEKPVDEDFYKSWQTRFPSQLEEKKSTYLSKTSPVDYMNPVVPGDTYKKDFTDPSSQQSVVPLPSRSQTSEVPPNPEEKIFKKETIKEENKTEAPRFPAEYTKQKKKKKKKQTKNKKKNK